MASSASTNIALRDMESNGSKTSDKLLPESKANGKDDTDFPPNLIIDAAARLAAQDDPLTRIVPGSPPDFNVYRNRKTLTQGLMDIALFSANANQLRFILENAQHSNAYFYICVSLIITSLILQIAVGLLLLISTQYNVTLECQREIAYKFGNYVTAGIFLITVVNVFIAAFGGPTVYNPNPPDQPTSLQYTSSNSSNN